MNAASPEIQDRWSRWLVERNQRGLRTGLLGVATLFPAFGVLDWLLAPRTALPWIWSVRALITIAAIVTLVLLPRPRIAAWIEPIGVAVTWLAAFGISLMTTYMGGLASPYYGGLLLVLIAAGLLLVWRPWVVIFANAVLVLTFIVVNMAAGQIGPLSTVVSNLAFLSAIALIAGIGQVLQFNTQREQLVQRVHLEQATAKLERAHAELKQLDEFKSRFFANMTHELRTPLAMILTPLELILQGELGKFSEAAASSFNSMYRSALKLLKLINDLLDLSRLEESRLRLHVGEHELVEYLRALTEQTQVLARRREIELVFAATNGQAVLRCDLERLERVFVNLLSNAIKFTPSGGHVHVSLAETPGAFEVVVQDDGPGFAPDQAERIFERFYQVDMEGTRRHGGAGIGLALARELVLLHGGTIRAESDGRLGARFVVTLPRHHAFREEDLASPTSPGGTASGEGGDASGDAMVQLERRHEFRLLDIEEATERRVVERDSDEEARPYTVVVAEDNPQVLAVIHMTLRREFKVLGAPDGLKGLELALREQPSLVITDLMMPGIDGLELTRRLRADPRTAHIPVLMLTARGEVDDRVKGLETGVAAYLTKPFSPRELVTSARQLVKAEEQTADLVLSRRMESIEIVAAGLAHEINNPLNYVKNALARIRLDAEKVLDVARKAGDRPLETGERHEVARSSARIDDMLKVAASGLTRIAGTVELLGRYGRAGYQREIASIDAWEAARTVVGVVLPATGRGVEIVYDFDGDGTLECVAEEFNQVLTNLVQNAIEASPDGAGRVRLKGSADGDALVLSVADNGPGIPADVQKRLFTPFFTTKGPGQGMGLGLTIVRRVVQSMGGTLQVVSAPGAGAEFVVRVPRRQRRGEPSPLVSARA
ncbi:MAG TPA: ATP-binding protein [Anaeromyxobacter sp.]